MDFQTPWFDFRLTGLADGWTCDYTCRREAEEICIAGFHFRNVQPGRLPACRLEFRVPWRDMQIKWMPRRNMADCHHFLPGWWNGGKFPYAVTHNQLLYVFSNEAGQNRLAFACSECCRAVLATCGVSGEYIECELFFNTTASDPAVEFSFEVKIDRRKLAYDCVLADLAEWQTRQYAPAPVPESAFLPVYSTWYQFQKEVSQAELEKELPEAAAAGLKNIIIDDGWQCAGNGGGDDMSATGEWLPEPRKFPDLAAFSKRCGEYGVGCLLWVGLPFVGKKCAAVYEKFRGKYLLENDSFAILDPRFPEVRRHLVGICRRLVSDYGLAGLKLDFIDQVHLLGRKDPMGEEDAAGRDFRSLEMALDRLLDEIHSELCSFRKDVLIEFRQFYSGPSIRQYCNILRAQDCPGDEFQNRMRTVDLRLTAVPTAVHADMMTWHPAEKVPVILRQLLNTLFSVPQISVRLADAPEEVRRALTGYLKFTEEYRELLLKGRLSASHPEHCYPVVSSTLGDEMLIAVYADGQVIEPPRGLGCVVVVNASWRDGVFLRVQSSVAVKIFDIFGSLLREETFSPGIREIAVPSTGYALLTPDGADRHFISER